MNPVQDQPRRNLYMIVTMLTLLVLLPACAGSATTDSVEQQFQSEIGAKIDPQITLQTIRDKYDLQGSIAYRVLNLSTHTLYFRDYSFNLHAYKYAPTEQKWIQLRLGFIVDQQLTVVQPGPPKGLAATYAIGASDIRSTGKIRLVVIGWDNPLYPDGSKIAAFKDIEIVATVNVGNIE